jgi:hypothetical protein
MYWNWGMMTVDCKHFFDGKLDERAPAALQPAAGFRLASTA